MVEAKLVGKRYLGKQAVKDVNMVWEDGRIYALLGPNGSGKTTFMKMVAGLVKPTAGELFYNGEKIGVGSKRKVAYMSTEPFFYSYMTVKHVGKYYADFFEDFSMARYEELIARMDLKMTDKAKELSKKSEMTEDEQKASEKAVQDLTDRYIREIDAITAKKTKDIMSI